MNSQNWFNRKFVVGFFICALMNFALILVAKAPHIAGLEVLDPKQTETLEWMPRSNTKFFCKIHLGRSTKFPKNDFAEFHFGMKRVLLAEKYRIYKKSTSEYNSSLSFWHKIRVYLNGLSDFDKDNIDNIYRNKFQSNEMFLNLNSYFNSCSYEEWSER